MTPADCSQSASEHHLVAGRQLRDARADLLHHAGGLVPQDDRRRGGKGAVGDGEVRVADAAVLHAHQHLARARVADLHVVDDLEGLAGFGQQSGAHVSPPRSPGLAGHASATSAADLV
jgi:hypothetical protein